MELGNRLAELRKGKDMSQEQLSEIFNVTRQTISSWENSKSYPDLESLVKISDIFNISLDKLLKEDKKTVKNIDDKIKKNKTLKVIIVGLIIIIVSMGAYFSITKYIDYLKNNKIIEKLDTLGFDKAKYGYLMLEEDGIGYHVYKSEKGKITYDEIYAESRDLSSNGITATYTKNGAVVRYFDEKTTVYCDKEGNLKKGENTDEAIAIYKKYEDQTKKIVKRMVELFNEIF